MTLITISRGCCSHGREVAEKVGGMLGCKVLSRENIIEEANQRYHVPEKELIKSIHDAPSVLERLTRGRERYLCFFQAVLLEHAKESSLVYHGHASHLMLPDISHVLNIRIIAEMADRIALLQQQENMSEKEAVRFITAEDTNRARWAHFLYKTDITNPHFYDMVLNIKNMNTDEAARIICQAAGMDAYQPTPETRKAIADLALKTRITAAIEHSCKPDLRVTVTANNGNVHIRAETQNIRKTGYAHPKTDEYVKETIKKEIAGEISEAIKGIEDIKNVAYEILPPSYS